MNTSKLKIIVASAVIAIGSATAAEGRIVANVPFSFIVNGVQLPAGRYVVEEASAGSSVLEIASNSWTAACTNGDHPVCRGDVSHRARTRIRESEGPLFSGTNCS